MRAWRSFPFTWDNALRGASGVNSSIGLNDRHRCGGAVPLQRWRSEALPEASDTAIDGGRTPYADTVLAVCGDMHTERRCCCMARLPVGCLHPMLSLNFV